MYLRNEPLRAAALAVWATTLFSIGVTQVDSNVALERWTYIPVDDARPGRAFGLGFGDVNGDGYAEIVSGPFVYRNPGGDMTGDWTRAGLGEGLDAMLVLDVDGDPFADVIAEDLLWRNDAKGQTCVGICRYPKREVPPMRLGL